MARKYLKFLIVLFMFALISAVVFVYVSGNLQKSSQVKTELLSSRMKKDLSIKGLRFDGYYEGKKAITVKAAKFSIEKKKVGIFKFSPVRAARFRGAEIDFHLNNDPHAAGARNNNDITFKVVFSKETIPASLLKGAASAVLEPVKISFCLDDTPVTEIRAKRALFEPLRRRIVLDGKILATAAPNQLSTNRLMIYPEKGLIEVHDHFVLKTAKAQISGENLTTDLFLKKVNKD